MYSSELVDTMSQIWNVLQCSTITTETPQAVIIVLHILRILSEFMNEQIPRLHSI